jgi:membrane protein
MLKNILNTYSHLKSSPFWKDILIHAASLSFKSILSLVPTLALVFSVAKGFGLQETLEPLILNNIIVGGESNDLIPKILEYVSNTNVKALGTIGLIFIVWTSISMVSQVEDSLNSIWNITTPRTLYRKFTDYLSILTIGPLLLTVTLSISPLISSHFITQKLMEYGLFAGAFRILLLTIPWFISILILTLLYLFMPNTKVRFKSAVIAGTIAGILWQLNQFIFIKFQIGVANYNAIYGTFASFPILLLWLNAGWIIILAGGILGYGFQNKNANLGMASFNEYPFIERERLLFFVMVSISRNFSDGKGGLSCETLSKDLSVPIETIQACCQILKEAGYISQLSEQNEDLVFIPAKPPETLLISDFFYKIKKQDSADNSKFPQELHNTITTLQKEAQAGLKKQFKNKTIHSLH